MKKKGSKKSESILTDTKSGDSDIAKIKRAIAKQDLLGLTAALYDAKTKKSAGNKEMQKVIIQAEEALVLLEAQV